MSLNMWLVETGNVIRWAKSEGRKKNDKEMYPTGLPGVITLFLSRIRVMRSTWEQIMHVSGLGRAGLVKETEVRERTSIEQAIPRNGEGELYQEESYLSLNAWASKSGE